MRSQNFYPTRKRGSNTQQAHEPLISLVFSKKDKPTVSALHEELYGRYRGNQFMGQNSRANLGARVSLKGHKLQTL